MASSAVLVWLSSAIYHPLQARRQALHSLRDRANLLAASVAVTVSASSADVAAEAGQLLSLERDLRFAVVVDGDQHVLARVGKVDAAQLSPLLAGAAQRRVLERED